MKNKIKKNTLVIGKGKWGTKVAKELKKKANIIKIINSKTSYRKIFTNSIDWVFILTDNFTHYKITKFFLKKKINVFCEKPLCLNFSQGKELVKLAKRNKVKIYVSDVEKYKYKKLNIKKSNKIIRTKFDKDKKKIIERLCYHDLYLLSEKVNFYKVKKVKIFKSETGNFNFCFVYKKKMFNFSYSLNQKNKIHKINNVDYLKFKGNPLNLMIQIILSSKSFFKKNNEQAIQTIYFINKFLKNG